MLSTVSKRNLSLWGGHIVECFDYSLYGFLAVMLAPIFFPPASSELQNVWSFAAFAIGFLSRPMGALLFGYIGDTMGRQIPIIWSMGFVSVPTIIIGLIPSYDSLGIAAPITLLICRIIQGICVGGEFAGVNVYNTENDDFSTLGSRTGILISVGVLGGVFATLSGVVFTSDSMPSWAWRIPFLMGGVMAIIVFYLRRQITETQDFIAAKSNNKISSNPWREIIAKYQYKLLLSGIIAGLTITPLYCVTVFANVIYKKLGYTHTEYLLFDTYALLLDALVIFLYGKLADKIGFHRQMLWGTFLTAAFVFPAFYLLSMPAVTTLHILSFISLLVIVGGVINGCALPYIARLFPISCRYSAVATSVTVGHALIGGSMPFISMYLQQYFDSLFAPAYWLFLVSLTAFVGIYFLKVADIKLKPIQAT